jgi:hypothetical protein
VKVLNPDGSTLTGSNYVGASGGGLELPALSSNGTYTLIATPQDSSSDTFSVTLSRDLTWATTPGDAPQPFSVSRVGQEVRIVFAGSSGEHVGLGLSDVTYAGSSCCEFLVTVLSPDGSHLSDLNWVGTSGGNVNVPSLQQSGAYTVLISPQGTGTGSFTVTLSDDAVWNTSPGDARWSDSYR